MATAETPIPTAPDRTVAPAVSDFGRLALPEPTVTHLPNGVVIYALDAGEQSVNRITLSWEGGLFDTPCQATMQLMSRLMSEGTELHTGAEIAETLDYNGAWLNVNAAAHHVDMSLMSLNRSTADLLPLLNEIVNRPAFPAEALESLRENMVSNLEVNMRKVAWMAQKRDTQAVFGATHPAAYIPSIDDVRAITRDDVAALYATTINASAPAIYIAGQTAGILPAVVEMASRWDFSGHRHIGINVEPRHSAADGTVSRTVIEGALQSAVAISYPTIGRDHPDYIPLRLAIMALGGYFGSRLMQNIREERGLTYGINASLAGYFEGGVVNILSQTDPANVDLLCHEVDVEVRRLVSEPPSGEELEAVKRYAESSLATTLDSPFSMMDMHITRRTLGTPPGYFDLQLKAIRSLTPDTIARLAEAHLLMAPKLTTIVGPE